MEQQLISAWQNIDGTILHLGAGECGELESYLETSAEQIVLVEPDPDAARVLRQRASAEPRVKVIEAAVAGFGDSGCLHRYNLTSLATLHPLKHLPTQWPGLKEVDQVNVKVLDLAQVMAQVGFSESKRHWLVVETPGEEGKVLRGIGECEEPQRFGYISLHLGCLTPQLEQVRPALLQTLEEVGYRLEHVESLPDQHVYHAKADILKVPKEEPQLLNQLIDENQRLQNENEALSEKLVQAEAQLNLMKELFMHGAIHE